MPWQCLRAGLQLGALPEAISGLEVFVSGLLSLTA